MNNHELITNAAEIIQASAEGPAGIAVNSTLGDAGGIITIAGKAVIGGLVKRGMDDLFKRYAKRKKAGKIPDDFEQTDHGASLLQEALNAMCQGLDEERVEAVKKVFLGLAMNPTSDSMEKMDQLQIMRITCELTMWEVTAINMLDRYCIERFDESTGTAWENATEQNEKDRIESGGNSRGADLNHFSEWKRAYCNADRARVLRLRDGIDSLNSKHVFVFGNSGAMQIGKKSIYIRKGNFTDFGWKLATHLRSAKDD